MTAPAKPNETDEKGIASGIIVDINGRIKAVKKFQAKSGDQFIATTVVRPAKDAYSHPVTFSVKSLMRIGNENADVTVRCELRPYSRRKDGEEYFNYSLWVIE
jgi:hypothetical protein